MGAGSVIEEAQPRRERCCVWVDDIGLDDRGCGAASYGCHQFLNWWLQYAAGILHLDGFESYIGQKENHHPKVVISLFGGRYRTRTYDLPHVKRML